MSTEREILVRKAELPDLLQVTRILNHWVLESNWALVEFPNTLVDVTEVYRLVTSLGLPYLVACFSDDRSHVLGVIFAHPESHRLTKIPGVVVNILFCEPGLKGLKLFERLLYPYLKILLQYPWFRGSISETNAGNTHIHHKHSPGYMVGKMPPIVLQGVLTKKNVWVNQGLEFFPRAFFQAVVENYEELTKVKV